MKIIYIQELFEGLLSQDFCIRFTLWFIVNESIRFNEQLTQALNKCNFKKYFKMTQMENLLILERSKLFNSHVFVSHNVELR